ncbi:aldose 1-epimerase [Rhodoferax sp.]|uniref:aldose 1-epimerase n=1 Tax=Rhodoferax sp. TaxID=50421 RepID=UPI0025F4576E|nr:aldose 1-epimerase [Rhodoferax sp.]
MQSNHGITLQAGPLRLAVRPDLGGSLAGLWHQGRPVLRSTEPGLLAGPRQSACFPLLPYSNRLGHRRFAWQGQNYTTEPNFDDSPHSLHGVGWLRAWQVVQQTADHLTLRYTHAPDGHWPFAFEAEQDITLTPQALRLDLRLRNTDTRTQPVGLGWHPYFPARHSSHLQVDVATRWERDASMLPTHATVQQGIDAPVRSLALDHCFGGWPGVAHIRDAQFALRLSSTLPYLVVFTPPGQPHFCVEPVGHVNNAIQHADPASQGLVALAPGAATTASLTLDVEAL